MYIVKLTGLLENQGWVTLLTLDFNDFRDEKNVHQNETNYTFKTEESFNSFFSDFYENIQHSMNTKRPLTIEYKSEKYIISCSSFLSFKLERF